MNTKEIKQSRLELVRAGAGSGKTHNLCETIAEAVADGLDPARILATTFTKKAAAELKGRIQSKLLAGAGTPKVNQRNADRLELAAIGTVHSVAHRLLSRYAVELGLSARLEVMSEESAERLVSEQLNRLESADWDQMVACSGRLGITDLENQLLKLLDAKRSNRISEEILKQNLQESSERVCQLLSPHGGLSSPAMDDLLILIQQALSDSAVQSCSTKDSQAARRKLTDLQSGRIHRWGVYCEAARLKAGKRSGAHDALQPLRNHGAEGRNHAELHADIQRYCDLLAQFVISIEDGCRRYKNERGLVDFTDLETLFLETLTGSQLPELIAKDFSMVLVDEFQDTNPLQLAIFQAFRQLAPRHRWVGDPKQAIFGFRGTDPSLVSRVWQQIDDAETSSLPNNRRSQRGLVQFVGQAFEPVFGQDAKQNPINPRSERNIERWLLTCSTSRRKNQEDDIKALVLGIRELQDEGHRLGDIVVLERFNAGVEKLASALEANGIEYLYESPGLLSTREGALTLAGMRLVLDRNDSLAAATVKHFLSSPSEETPTWIIERLTERMPGKPAEFAESDNSRKLALPWEGDSQLQPLERIDRKTSSPHSVCQLVIEALDLPTRIAKWGEVAQRSSNLDSILTHVSTYEDQMVGMGKAATLGGAILYLEQLANDGLDIKYPPYGHDAVTIMTYHKSKGLQWPIVILSGLNSFREPNMWRPSVSGGGDDVYDPLSGRSIRAWSWPFGMDDRRPPQRRTGISLDADAIASPEGMQQAAEELDESLRLLYVGFTRAQSKLVLAHRRDEYQWLEKLPQFDDLLSPDLDAGEHLLHQIDTTYVVRHLDAANTRESSFSENGNWFKAGGLGNEVSRGPRYHSPSDAVPALTDDRTLVANELSGSSFFPEGLATEHYSAFGDAVHAYLAALPSLIQVEDSQKLKVASRCLASYQVDGSLAPSILVQVGTRFIDWVDTTFPNAIWKVEVSAIAKRSAGGTYKGTLDLILQLADRSIAVIDHKSAPIRRNQCVAKAMQYVGQVDSYDEILAQQGLQVASRWIHFPLAGVMVEVPERLTAC